MRSSTGSLERGTIRLADAICKERGRTDQLDILLATNLVILTTNSRSRDDMASVNHGGCLHVVARLNVRHKAHAGYIEAKV